MRPQDDKNPSGFSIPPRQMVAGPAARSRHADAAADLARTQLDRIYANDPNLTTEQSSQTATVGEVEPASESATTSTTPEASSSVKAGPGAVNMSQQAQTPTNPYERTHDESKHQVEPSTWQKYHSAWQNYYQQYYERYYLSQVHETKKSLEAQTAIYRDTPQRPDETLSSDEAMYDLRAQLRSQITERAKKVRKSRHFIPIMAAVTVMLLFAFMQYNRVLFSYVEAYVSPGTMDPSTLIVDPGAATTVSSEPQLIIPKINVNVPIIFNANAASQDSLNAAMDKGVAWFNIRGASAKPGQVGNFVLSGHSSNDWIDQGDYKFIFARLEQLSDGDTVYVNYKSTRYTYIVNSKKVVKPTDVSALTDSISKPRITLVTCTPLGTALNRLLVFADQVSPDPGEAKAAATSDSSATQMPSNSPTFLQRIFGGGN